MANAHAEQLRIDRQLTAAANRSTGTFYCSSSNHRATGDPVMIRGRRVCKACADRRRKVLSGKAHG